MMKDVDEKARLHHLFRSKLGWILFAVVTGLPAAHGHGSESGPELMPGAINLRVEEVDNSPGGSELSGFVTSDILFDLGETQFYFGSQLFVNLTSGGFYRHPNGNPSGAHPGEPGEVLSVPFTPDDFPGMPSQAYDTYVSSRQLGGGAVCFTSDPIAVFPANGGNLLSQVWSDSSTTLSNLEDKFDARLTLSDDAYGSFSYLVVLFDSESGRRVRSYAVLELDIFEGHIVPEPSSMAGAIALFLGLRRAQSCPVRAPNE